MYNVKFNLSPKYIGDMFLRNSITYNLRVKEFQIPRFNTVGYGKLLWSKLPFNVRTAISLVTFKTAIRKFDLKVLMNNDDCKNCPVCRT